jgi:hypothetical protein
LIRLIKAEKMRRQENKKRALDLWVLHCKRWRLLRKMAKLKSRKLKEKAFRKWILQSFNSHKGNLDQRSIVVVNQLMSMISKKAYLQKAYSLNKIKESALH